MKEIIKEKLNQMEDLEQRKILKGILEDLFENLVDYQEEMNKELEQRVFSEVEDNETYYDIYTTLVKREKLKLVDDFLFPLCEEDREEETYDKKEIIKKLAQDREVSITNVFLNVEHDKIREIIERDRTYSGTIITENKNYSVTLDLRKTDQYLKKEKELYEIFLKNSVKWKTINNPYIRKIFEIVIVEGPDDNIEDLTDFKEIRFDLKEFDDDKYINYVPVWNVEWIGQKSETFPLPADDKINYNHLISLEDMGRESGYLVVPDDFNIISLKKGEEDLILTSNKGDLGDWELLRIHQKQDVTYEDLKFNLTTNSRKTAFINKFSEQNRRAIKTFGELNRIINSFEIGSEFKLENTAIKNSLPEGETTYDFNCFIEDEIRADSKRKVMELEFTTELDNSFKYDFLSFIVSEIQRYFPEYICRGVLEDE